MLNVAIKRVATAIFTLLISILEAVLSLAHESETRKTAEKWSLHKVNVYFEDIFNTVPANAAVKKLLLMVLLPLISDANTIAYK